jgi:hypothetical protein
MSAELHGPNDSLAGFVLSVSTLLMLQKNGTLLDGETIEIVDKALGILQNHEPDGGVQSQNTWQSARELLTRLRASLSSATCRKKHINY